jgi:hypothetical protein
MGVMNSVILAPHDWIHIPIHSIVNVSCPYSREKYHGKMGQVMAGDEWQETNIRTCLQHAVEWMKGNRTPGCKRFGSVVFVVLQVDVFVKELVRVKGTMHPIDSDFDAEEVEAHRGNVILPSSNFLNGMINFRVAAFNKVFVQDGQTRVNHQCRLRQLYLTLDGLPAGPFSILSLKDEFGLWMDVAKVMKRTGRSIINNHAGDKVSHITEDIVCPLNIVVKLMYEPSGNVAGKENRIDPGIEITAGVPQRVVL